MQAMVLAAGFGTRLLPYTKRLPKPLFPVANKPLLLRTIDRLQHCGFTHIHVNAHHLAAQIRKALHAHDPGIHVQIEEKILGTGGGLRKLLPHLLHTPLLVINGDILHTVDLRDVCRVHAENGALATLVLHNSPRFNNVVVNAASDITGFVRQPQMKKMPGLLAFTGIQVLNPEILSLVPKDSFYDSISLYEQVIAQGGRVHGHIVHDHYWRDMGTVADYLALHEELLCGSAAFRRAVLGEEVSAPFCLVQGVDCAKVTFRDWAAVGKDVVFKGTNTLKRVVVWDNARIEENAVMQDRILMPLSEDRRQKTEDRN